MESCLCPKDLAHGDPTSASAFHILLLGYKHRELESQLTGLGDVAIGIIVGIIVFQWGPSALEQDALAGSAARWMLGTW